MIKKFHIVVLMVMLVVFLTPAWTYACGMKSEKSCCNKEISSTGDEKDCCNKDIDSKNKSQDGGCNGKCGHSSCTTSSSQFSLAFFEIRFKNNNVVFSEKEQNYYHSEAHLSSGFCSIWLIPKIG